MASHVEEVIRDGVEVSEHDSYLRAESVDVGQGSADGMCLNIYHLWLRVSSCVTNHACRLLKAVCNQPALKRQPGVNKPSVSSVSVSFTIPVHFATKYDVLDLRQMLCIRR